jgi:hypothetical protein
MPKGKSLPKCLFTFYDNPKDQLNIFKFHGLSLQLFSTRPELVAGFGAAIILNRGIFLYGAATAAQYTERLYGLF